MIPRRGPKEAGARTARFELRLTPKERTDLTRAAEADGNDASSWARRVLRDATAERIAKRKDDEVREPTEAEMAAALAARGVMSEADARHMAEILERAREPWGSSS